MEEAWTPSETKPWKELARSKLLNILRPNKPDVLEGSGPLFLFKLHVHPLIYTSAVVDTKHKRDRERKMLLNKGATYCRNAGACDLRYFFA